MRLAAEYVLPLRWSPEVSRRDAPELGEYLRWLSTLVEVTVVDGSDPEVFHRHDELWSDHVRHVRPEPWPGRYGKVAGVVTGVRAARHEQVVIADDDVRYDAPALEAVLAALGTSDLVRPQNVFTDLPWHARWDTGRSLLNVALLGHDYPGTHGVRRSTFLAMGGYDGDALFENLELARTVTSVGGTVADLPGVSVRRLPPATGHFWSQRVRQAYDDLAQPGRLVAELSLLPLLLLTLRRKRRGLAGWALLPVLVAEVGRRRAGGTRVHPRTAALWALPWLAERAVCVWLAVAQIPRGGVPYAGTRLSLAAHSRRTLRRHVRQRPPLVALHIASDDGDALAAAVAAEPGTT